jgi:hypothetical protein
LDRESIGSADPDQDSQSLSGSRQAKTDPKIGKILKITFLENLNVYLGVYGLETYLYDSFCSVADPGCLSLIPEFFHPEYVVKKILDLGSGSALKNFYIFYPRYGF